MSILYAEHVNGHCEIKLRRKRKATRMSSPPARDSCFEMNAISGVMLATISRFGHHSSAYHDLAVIKNRLRHINDKPITSHAVISLLPWLLNSKCAELVAWSAEIVGAASLSSFETNELIASDNELMRSLTLAFTNTSKTVLNALCNAILDLSTTHVGRLSLLKHPVMDNLVFAFVQVLESSRAPDPLGAHSQGSIICYESTTRRNGLLLFLVTTSIPLINTCSVAQLDNIRRKLPKSFLLCLKDLWAVVHKGKLLRNLSTREERLLFCLDNITPSALVECIFRLSMKDARLVTTLQSCKVRQRVFGSMENCFKDFLVTHWEAMPSIRRTASWVHTGDIFNSILKSLNLDATSPFSVSGLLSRLVSCVPISSHELDIIGFLEQAKNCLGCSIIYQQDIRVLKTDNVLRKEVHFFPEPENPTIFTMDDILGCEEAYNKGYTIALRGMELRVKSIARVADTFASLFGQPSVGANLYLTPPNSQGLARHYDDHCVLLFQILGSKKWRVFCRPTVQLPRLYEPLCNVSAVNEEFLSEFVLEEGDILYIPRGFAHEASTVMDQCSTSGSTDRLSLHLTISIEIEPPFEWEGFIHVALCCWYGSCTLSDGESSSENLVFICSSLVHIQLLILGESNPAFRKACLVGMCSSEPDIGEWLDRYQRTIFSSLMDNIRTTSALSEVISLVNKAMQNEDDLFRQIRWLESVDLGDEDTNARAYVQAMRMENFVCLFAQAGGKVKTAFEEVKYKFCEEAEFGMARAAYLNLLEKYRKTRNQYRNGMLSLHHSLQAMSW